MPGDTIGEILGGTILALVEDISNAPDSLSDAAYAFRLGRINGVFRAFRQVRDAIDLEGSRRANAGRGGTEEV